MIRSTPSLRLSTQRPLKVGDRFTVFVNIGKLSDGWTLLEKPISVELVTSDHFQIRNAFKRFSPNDLRKGVRVIRFQVKMVKANRAPQIIRAYFNYNGRPSGMTEWVPQLSP